MKKLAYLAAALVVFAVGKANGATVVFSENFEGLSSAVTQGGYTSYGYNQGITGPGGSFFQSVTLGANAWTFRNVDAIKGNYGAIQGVSIDLNGNRAGSIASTFATTAGQQYRIEFDYRGNGASPDKDFLLSLGLNQTEVFLTGGTSTSTPIRFSTTFSATTAATAIRFNSQVSGYGGAVVDNVLVSQVPEPSDFAMMLAGLAVVGAVVRKRSK
jgi:hypothetical protein